MLSDEDFAKVVDLIEDGELDDYMIELQRAIDERNSRRKKDILRLVKSVYGEDAEVTEPGTPKKKILRPKRPAPEHDQIVDDGFGPEEPSTGSAWPSAIVSSVGIGDSMGNPVAVSPIGAPE